MRRLATAIAVLVLAGCSPAAAAFASVTDTLTTSGKCKVAANWSLGVTPGPYDAYVPAGKTLRAEGGLCAMRSLDLEGTLAGNGQVQVGNSLRAEGPAGPDVAVKITGSYGDLTPLELTGSYLGTPQLLDLGPTEVRSLRIPGTAHYQLGEDATHFGTEFWLGEGAWFDTAGHNVGGMGYTQLGLPSTLKLHASDWDTGEWRVANSIALEAGEATVHEDDGSYGIFEGHGQTFGNVIVQNHRPHVIESFTVNGTLSLEQTADGTPIVFAGPFLPNERPEGTIHLNQLATNGTEATPVVTEGRVTLAIPHDLTVEGCLTLPEATVTGGTITVECGTQPPVVYG